MRKVLVADSANITHFMLERILGRDGYQIFYVKYPRDLVVQVREILPDIIFLEPEISGGKGKKIVDYLARRPETSRVPIILLTRITDTAKYNMESWQGVHRVVRKPLGSQRVLDAVNSIEFDCGGLELENLPEADAG